MSRPRDSRADEFDKVLGLFPQTPGHNAWAAKEVQSHRARLQGNAFYQQEYLQQKGLPPDTVHPAFTDPNLINDLSHPIPQMAAPSPHVQSHQRESSVTTMSQFLGPSQQQPAQSPARGQQKAAQSPALNLGTTPDNTRIPTQRAHFEERTEQRLHQQSGSKRSTKQIHPYGFDTSAYPPFASVGITERTPVFHPTPKVGGDAFESTQPTVKKQKEVRIVEQPSTAVTPSVKDRTGFFSRFGLGRRQTPKTPAAVNIPSASDSIPPKAQQFFGSKTSHSKLPRSPSKVKGFLSRSRRSGGDDLNLSASINDTPTAAPNESPRAATSMGFSRGHDRKSSEFADRVNSQGARSSQPSTVRSNNTTLARSRSALGQTPRTASLKYFDHVIPPTPPSKDTPPDERAARYATNSSQDPIVAFANDTPTQSHGFVSTQGGLSPTRHGTYAQRTGARLITQPSMHSLRASVVPEAMNQADFEDVKGRLNGLGLEGFTLPHETRRPAYDESPLAGHGTGQYTYSPSIYSPEMGRKSIGQFPLRQTMQAPLEDLSEEDTTPPDGQKKQMAMKKFSSLHNMSFISEDSRSQVTVPIMYPDLENDPSISDFMKYQADQYEINDGFVETSQRNMRQIGRLLREDSPTLGGLIDPEFQPAHKASRRGDAFAAPSSAHVVSPNSSHPSAMISPLRVHLNAEGFEVLPPLTYDPEHSAPQMKVKRRSPAGTPTRQGLQEYGGEMQMRGSPSPFTMPKKEQELRRTVLENKPSYLPVRKEPHAHATDVDPKKHVTPSQKTSAQRIIEEINDRNKNVEEMTTVATRTNAAPDKSSELHLSGGTQQQGHQRIKSTEKQKPKRLSTSYAHDFYRATSPEAAAMAGAVVMEARVPPVRDSEASTIILTPNLPKPENMTLPKSKTLANVDLAGAIASRKVTGTHPALRDGTSSEEELAHVVREQGKVIRSYKEEIEKMKEQIAALQVSKA